MLVKNTLTVYNSYICFKQIEQNNSSEREYFFTWCTEKGWFLGVADTNDVIQKIEKTLNNTHTTTQKLTNNSFRNTKKHPEKGKNYE